LGQGFGEGRLEKTKGTIATNREPIPSNMAIRNNEEKTFSLIELGFAELAISPMGIPTKTVPTVIPKAVAFHIYEVCLFFRGNGYPPCLFNLSLPDKPKSTQCRKDYPVMGRNAPYEA